MPDAPVPTPPRPATRLAPSPTGALHLGNVRTFLVTWAMARRRGWRIVMRIEDLDGPRVKPGAAEAVLDTLAWLGIDWDEGPHVQSSDLSPYQHAMRSLASRGLVYPCELTRTEIEAAASAPQESGTVPAADTSATPGTEARFPPELRPAGFDAPRAFENPETNWRFAVSDETIGFDDLFAGVQRRRPIDSIGDFTVWTKRAQPSYQLAVVVDDIRHGVTHVIRGDDLLDSAARQLLLYRALGHASPPAWCHLPLVVGPDGRRLAKRHGDTRVSMYRDLGVPARRIIGLMASWCGIAGAGPGTEMDAAKFAARFDLATMSRDRVVFTSEHDRWLRSGTTSRGAPRAS